MNLTNSLRTTVLALAVTFAAGLLFVNVYNSVVDATNWGSNVPISIESARAYFKAATPGTFFRVAAPLNQILALAALILCWKAGPKIRLLTGAGLLLTIAADAMTFGYFYPRNELMFGGTASVEALQLAQAQWASMNWVRSGIVFLNLAVSFSALISVVQSSTREYVGRRTENRTQVSIA